MSPLLVMLLTALGPLMVTFVSFNEDDPEQTDTDADTREATPEGPVEIVDVATFI